MALAKLTCTDCKNTVTKPLDKLARDRTCTYCGAALPVSPGLEARLAERARPLTPILIDEARPRMRPARLRPPVAPTPTPAPRTRACGECGSEVDHLDLEVGQGPLAGLLPPALRAAARCPMCRARLTDDAALPEWQRRAGLAGLALCAVAALAGVIWLPYRLTRKPAPTAQGRRLSKLFATPSPLPGSLAPRPARAPARDTELLIDNHGDGPLLASLDGSRFEVAAWSMARRPLTGGAHRLTVEDGGRRVLERAWDASAGTTYLANPRKTGIYVSDRVHYSMTPFGGSGSPGRQTHEGLDWLAMRVDIRIGERTPSVVYGQGGSRTRLRKHLPRRVPAGLAARLVATDGGPTRQLYGGGWESRLVSQLADAGPEAVRARLLPWLTRDSERDAGLIKAVRRLVRHKARPAWAADLERLLAARPDDEDLLSAVARVGDVRLISRRYARLGPTARAAVLAAARGREVASRAPLALAAADDEDPRRAAIAASMLAGPGALTEPTVAARLARMAAAGRLPWRTLIDVLRQGLATPRGPLGGDAMALLEHACTTCPERDQTTLRRALARLQDEAAFDRLARRFTRYPPHARRALIGSLDRRTPPPAGAAALLLAGLADPLAAVREEAVGVGRDGAWLATPAVRAALLSASRGTRYRSAVLDGVLERARKAPAQTRFALLVGLLGECDGSRQRTLISLLEQLPEPDRRRAADAVARQLPRITSSAAREAALRVLAGSRFGSRSRATYLALLRDARPAVRQATFSLLFGQARRDRELPGPLLAAAASEPDAQVKTAIEAERAALAAWQATRQGVAELRALGRRPRDDAQARQRGLALLLAAQSRDVAEAAVRLLRHRLRPSDLESLVTHQPSLHETARVALPTLAWIQPAAPVSARLLKAAATDPAARVRTAAYGVLYSLARRQPSLRPVFAEALAVEPDARLQARYRSRLERLR